MVWNSPARVSNSADGRAVTPADLHLCLCPGQEEGGRAHDCALCVVACRKRRLQWVARWLLKRQKSDIMAGFDYWMINVV